MLFVENLKYIEISKENKFIIGILIQHRYYTIMVYLVLC